MVLTLYHPQGNMTVGQAHSPLVEVIVKACSDHIGKWPVLLPTALFAIWVTVSRAMGFAPYYLLYGIHPILSFDLEEATWTTLNWDKVTDMIGLLAIRILQLCWWDPNLREASEQV